MQAYGTSIDVVHLYQLYLDEQTEIKNNEIKIVEVSKSITPVKITKINSSNENNKEIFLSIFDSLEINIEYDVISDELDEVVSTAAINTVSTYMKEFRDEVSQQWMKNHGNYKTEGFEKNGTQN